MLAQKQPPLKECVIAHWSRDSAPKMTGAEVRNRSFGMYADTWVGERSCMGEAVPEGAVDRQEERMPV